MMIGIRKHKLAPIVYVEQIFRELDKVSFCNTVLKIC